MSRVVIGVLLGLAACGHRAPQTPAPAADAARATVVTLERGPCFGTCPVYRVSLRGDGAVEFVGSRFVSQVGTDSARVPPDSVIGLVRSLETSGFFDLADAYVPDAPSCGRFHTDAPTVLISIETPKQSKTVRHDHGCGGAPEQLTGFEHLIDSVAGTARWIGR